jgi:protein-tyrosine-phosphatase
MAEAFARAYGSDVLIPFSAGFVPAQKVPGDTLRAMEEKNLDLNGRLPKGLNDLEPTGTFDIIINMSGFPLPTVHNAQIRDWAVPDPVTMNYENHCKVRDQIEDLVMKFILELRRQQKRAAMQPRLT